MFGPIDCRLDNCHASNLSILFLELSRNMIQPEDAQFGELANTCSRHDSKLTGVLMMHVVGSKHL